MLTRQLQIACSFDLTIPYWMHHVASSPHAAHDYSEAIGRAIANPRSGIAPDKAYECRAEVSLPPSSAHHRR